MSPPRAARTEPAQTRAPGRGGSREPLVRASLMFRRFVRRTHGLAVVAALSASLLAGGLEAPWPAQVTALGAWIVWLGLRLRTKLALTTEAPLVVDFELGALLALGLDAGLLRAEGGLSGPLSPAVYVLVALVAAFARPLAGVLVVCWVVLLEALVRHLLLGQDRLLDLAPHAAFVAAFALLNLAFLRAEVARVRATAHARVEGELRRLQDDARSYRLLGAGEGQSAAGAHIEPAEQAENRLARSSVEEIHLSVHYALDLLRKTLGLHTAVLLWLNDSCTHLKISELSSESDAIQDAPIAVGDGIVGAVLARRERVAFTGLKPSHKVPYYVGGCPVRVLAAFPVIDPPPDVDGRAARPRAENEAPAVRGVLVIDRADARPFTPHEEELAAQAARYCLRAIQNERVFVQLERAKVEQGKLYRAAQALGAALSEKDVLEAAVSSARQIASFDLAAVTVFDEATRTHEVCAARGEGNVDQLVGTKFTHNAGLVSMVVTNRFPLPYKGEYDAAHQVVLTKRTPWPKLPSLLVLPLVVHDRPLGTLILGARRKHAFGDSVRATLEVLASHLAVSLSNARMVHKLETLATTDGLTGLLNKRAMLDAAVQKIQAATRFGRKLSVLVTDIDFFKKVNDTYGHDTGDVVIRGLGDVLRRHKRATDLVARFGGEEFVVLCEETDERGAMLLAERIREELAKTSFPHATGTLQVTCSIGVATFGGGATATPTTWETLFKQADEALYVSKRSGRNRSTAAAPPPRVSESRALAGTRTRAAG